MLEEEDEGGGNVGFGCVGTICKQHKNNVRRNLVIIVDVHKCTPCHHHI